MRSLFGTAAALIAAPGWFFFRKIAESNDLLAQTVTAASRFSMIFTIAAFINNVLDNFLADPRDH